MAVVDWFLLETERSPWTGEMTGVRNWPDPGGILRQPPRLVMAAQLLLAETRVISSHGRRV